MQLYKYALLPFNSVKDVWESENTGIISPPHEQANSSLQPLHQTGIVHFNTDEGWSVMIIHFKRTRTQAKRAYSRTRGSVSAQGHLKIA